MIIPLIVILFALLALISLVVVARGHAAAISQTSELHGRTRAVDLQAFRNLVDPVEREYLRQQLSSREYRKIQRERLRAAVEYVDAVSANAAVLLRLGEAARSSADPAVAEAGTVLVNTALRVRLHAVGARARFYAGILVPSLALPGPRVSESYEHLTGMVVQLGRLQNQRQGLKLSTVL